MLVACQQAIGQNGQKQGGRGSQKALLSSSFVSFTDRNHFARGLHFWEASTEPPSSAVENLKLHSIFCDALIVMPLDYIWDVPEGVHWG